MLPNFLIIGAPKAATTWIADSLREHPDVFVPQIKELRFFCGKNFDKGRDWFEGHFRKVAGERAIGEASPSYLGSPEAPARIHAALPEAKLIVSLRHPIEQAHSFYWHQLTRGLIRLDTDFQDFFDRERPRASYYGCHVSRYLSIFAPDQLLILLYEEDIERDPRQGMQKCYEFLNVDPEFTPTGLAKRSNAKRDVTKFHGAARIARRCLGALPRELGQPVKRVSKSILKRLPKKRPQGSLDPHLRRQLLKQHYLDDVRQLEQVTGIDFAVWYEG